MTDEMRLFMKKIIDVSELKDFPAVEKRLEEIGEGFIFQNNRPTHVLMTVEQYEALCNTAGNQPTVVPVKSSTTGSGFFSKFFSKSDDTSAQTANDSHIEKTSPTFSDDEENEVKIGKMMRGIFTVLLQKKLLSEEELRSLTSGEYSKNIFNANLPILKTVAVGENPDHAKRDGNGYNRYYDVVISVGDTRYMISSQWFEAWNRTYADKWAVSKLTDILVQRVKQLPVETAYSVSEQLADFWNYLGNSVRQRIGKDYYYIYVCSDSSIEVIGDTPHGQRYRKIH